MWDDREVWGQGVWGFDQGVWELTRESGTGADGSTHDSISPSRPHLKALSSEGVWEYRPEIRA